MNQEGKRNNMGYVKPRKRAKGWIKVIDPKPIWEIKIKEVGKSEYRVYAGTEDAQKYYDAGFPVKMITTAGELQQYEEKEE